MTRRFRATALTKKLVGFGAIAFVVLGGIGAIAGPPKQANLNAQTASSGTSVLGAQTTSPSSKPAPIVTTQTVTETQPIPFLSTTTTSNLIPVGQTRITTIGVDGIATLTYKVTYTDGVQTDKALVSQVTTIPPTTQVTSIGTYVAPKVSYTPAPAPSTSSCDPNYSGCVPNVYPADVDCGGGSGNGPYYQWGMVHVIGIDHYNLDADNDGYGCE